MLSPAAAGRLSRRPTPKGLDSSAGGAFTLTRRRRVVKSMSRCSPRNHVAFGYPLMVITADTRERSSYGAASGSATVEPVYYSSRPESHDSLRMFDFEV
jgi:hypothetical protein